MASSRPSYHQPDVKDTASALSAFEEQNKIRIVTTLRSALHQGQPDLWLEGKALSERSENGDRTLLAFASVRCLAMNHKHLDTALLALLYALDFQLAEKEWGEAEKAAKLPPAQE